MKQRKHNKRKPRSKMNLENRIGIERAKQSEIVR